MGTDRYAYLSRLRRVDPVAKVWVSLAVLLLCLFSESIAVGLVTLAVMSVLNIALGGQRPGTVLHFMKVPLAFLVIGCLTIVIRPIPAEEPALWAVWLFGRFRCGITQTYLHMGLMVFCKAMGAISAMYFLALNTPMTDLILALERLHVPKLLVELMELIYRFIFVLMDTAGRIRVAQESRLGSTWGTWCPWCSSGPGGRGTRSIPPWNPGAMTAVSPPCPPPIPAAGGCMPGGRRQPPFRW